MVTQVVSTTMCKVMVTPGRDDALNLSVVPESLRERAREAFDKGDGLEFVCLVNNQHALALVFDNIHAPRERGCYEQALVHAFIGCRVNHSHWPDGVIKFLFRLADKRKLRAAGDSVPEDTVTVFRGVSGRGHGQHHPGRDAHGPGGGPA
jgi:hypothetical protein